MKIDRQIRALQRFNVLSEAQWADRQIQRGKPHSVEAYAGYIDRKQQEYDALVRA